MAYMHTSILYKFNYVRIHYRSATQEHEYCEPVIGIHIEYMHKYVSISLDMYFAHDFINFERKATV